jgi:hypothetical protein
VHGDLEDLDMAVGLGAEVGREGAAPRSIMSRLTRVMGSKLPRLSSTGFLYSTSEAWPISPSAPNNAASARSLRTSSSATMRSSKAGLPKAGPLKSIMSISRRLRRRSSMRLFRKVVSSPR